jgi:hypothetical protein
LLAATLAASLLLARALARLIATAILLLTAAAFVGLLLATPLLTAPLLATLLPLACWPGRFVRFPFCFHITLSLYPFPYLLLVLISMPQSRPFASSLTSPEKGLLGLRILQQRRRAVFLSLLYHPAR